MQRDGTRAYFIRHILNPRFLFSERKVCVCVCLCRTLLFTSSQNIDVLSFERAGRTGTRGEKKKRRGTHRTGKLPGLLLSYIARPPTGMARGYHGTTNPSPRSSSPFGMWSPRSLRRCPRISTRIGFQHVDRQQRPSRRAACKTPLTSLYHLPHRSWGAQSCVPSL